jgi:hypothetical protein
MQETPGTPGGAGPDPSVPPPPPAAPAQSQSGRSKGLVERAKDIVTSPKTEWGVIDAEPASVGGLFTGYAMVLAAIGPLATIIGLTLVGFPIGYAITMAAIAYAISLAGVFINAAIIDALAPSFGGSRNLVQAAKVAVYSATPVWLAGILNLVPQLAVLAGLVALAALGYGIYLLYLGLPRLMRVTPDKAAGYVLVVIAVWILVYVLLAFVVAGLVLSMVYSSAMVAGGALPGY